MGVTMRARQDVGGSTTGTLDQDAALRLYFMIICPWVAYALSSTLVFYCLRSHPIIQKRHPLLTTLSSLSSTFSSAIQLAQMQPFTAATGFAGSPRTLIWTNYVPSSLCLFVIFLRSFSILSDYHAQAVHAHIQMSKDGAKLPIGFRVYAGLRRMFGDRFGQKQDSMMIQKLIDPSQPISRADVSVRRSVACGDQHPGELKIGSSGVLGSSHLGSSEIAGSDRGPSVINGSTAKTVPVSMDSLRAPMAAMFKQKTLLKYSAIFLVWQGLVAVAAEAISGCLVEMDGWPCENRLLAWIPAYLAMPIYIVITPLLLSALSILPDSYCLAIELKVVILIFDAGLAWYIATMNIPALYAWACTYQIEGTLGLFLVCIFGNWISITAPAVAVILSRAGVRLPGSLSPPEPQAPKPAPQSQSAGTLPSFLNFRGRSARGSMQAHSGPQSSTTATPSVAEESLEVTLRRPASFSAFKRSAAMDFALENVLFYEEYMVLSKGATNVTHIYHSTVRRGHPATAGDLYLMFIRTGAPYELNLSEYCRNKVTELYEQRGTQFTVDHLALAYKEVFTMMNTCIHPRYRERCSISKQKLQDCVL